MNAKKRAEPLIVGWREMVELPDLDLGPIRAKIDTGAETSALHATHIRVFEREEGAIVSFRLKHADGVRRTHRLPMSEFRSVRSSNGMSEERPTIRTRIGMGGRVWSIPLTLTNRGRMLYPMLVGRNALKRHALVDCSRSYALGSNRAKETS